MQRRWSLAPLSFAVLVGCSTSPAASPSPTLFVVESTPTNAPATPSAAVDRSPLAGRWATGTVPIADIKASMIAAGIDPGDADAWIAEVGSPTQYSFVLTFTGTAFTHSEATPEMGMEVGESGTFALTGTELVLTIGEPGNVDTYTFEATLAGDKLSLQWVDSTEQGTAGDKEKHRFYTIAFYCAAVFEREQ